MWAQRQWCRDRAPPVEVMRGAPVRGRAPADGGEKIYRGRASLNPYLAHQMSDLWVPMDLSSSMGLKASLPTKSLRRPEQAKQEHTQGLPRFRTPLRCKTLLLLVWLFTGIDC